MPVNTTSTISEQIKQIPLKKEALRKSLESLQSFSSLINLNIQWEDIEDHFSPIESSIYQRFNSSPEINRNMKTKTESETILKSFCTNMDPVGLRNHVATNRLTLEELTSALKSASNPAVLVLDTICGYYPDQISKNEVKSVPRKDCLKMLESLYMLSDDVKEKVGLVKDRAMALAVEWKGKLTDNSAFHTMGFLLIIVIYGLVSEFKVDEILNYFVNVAKLRQAVSLVKPLGLEDKCHVIIEKLCSQSRQLDAIKIVHAFNLVDKFPPVSLIKASLTDAKNKSLEMQKGIHSNNDVREATAKEINALKLAIAAIEEFDLEKEYPRAEISKRISELEQQKEADKKKATKLATASSSKSAPPQQQQQSKKRSAERKTHQPQQRRPLLNKRWQPSPVTSAPPPVISTNPYYNSQLLIQAQSLPGLDERVRATYMPGPGPYASVYSPIRGRNISSFSGAQLSSQGGARAGSPPPRAQYYSVESLAGIGTLQPRVYERPVVHRGYDGLPDRIPPAYGSTLYR